MKEIFDNIDNYIIIFNKEKKIIHCNIQLLKKLGYELTDIIDKYIDDKIIKDNDELIMLENEFENLNKNYSRYKMINKNNNIVDLSGRVFKTTFEKEEVYCLLLKESEKTDNEDSKEIINSLNKQLEDIKDKYIDAKEEISLLLNTTTDLLGVIEKDGTIIKSGNMWNEILGWNEEDLKSIKWQELFHQDEVEDSLRIARRCRNEKPHIETHINRCRCKNGEYKLIFWKCIYVEEKEVYVGAGTDITMEKWLEKERKKYEEAFYSEYIKNEFLANMSHEFKTPLNIILSAVQLINHWVENNYIKSDNNFDIIKYVNSIKQNSYRLLRLVNNILEVSSIDMGSYNINLENYNIVDLIEDIVTSVANYLKGRNISITFDTDIEEIIIACDREKIEKIVLNLISNAIKYTQNHNQSIGKINIHISLEKNEVKISIKDNGIGIPKEEWNCIFEKFKRVDTKLNRQVEGSGIGLSLVKSLVELHDGKIYVESQVGEGTEFIFTLPIRCIDSKNKIDLGMKAHSDIKKCDVEFSDIYAI